MELDFTSEERRFRDELREYIGELMTDELVAELSVQREGGGPEFRKLEQSVTVAEGNLARVKVSAGRLSNR